MKKNEFINEYEYNDNIISEVMKLWWYSKSKEAYIAVGATAIIMFILFLIFKNNIYLLLLFLMVILIIFFELKKLNIIKSEVTRTNVLYKNEKLNIKVIIDDSIHMITSQNERNISFDDIENISESSNVIVLSCKGDMTVTLVKDSFVSGDWKSCVTYLEEKINKK